MRNAALAAAALAALAAAALATALAANQAAPAVVTAAALAAAALASSALATATLAAGGAHAESCSSLVLLHTPQDALDDAMHVHIEDAALCGRCVTRRCAKHGRCAGV